MATDAAKVSYSEMGDGGKVRLTLRMPPDVKAALVKRARSLGATPSAYVAMLMNEDVKRSGPAE